MRKPPKSLRTKRVLIIEDDPVHRLMIERELQQRYEIDFAADSQTSLACLLGGQSSSYDLVVVDLRIPARIGEPAQIEEGYKVLRGLRKNSTSSSTILVVSGNVVDQTRRAVKKLGVQHIIEKPFSPREFGEFVDSLLDTSLYLENFL